MRRILFVLVPAVTLVVGRLALGCSSDAATPGAGADGGPTTLDGSRGGGGTDGGGSEGPGDAAVGGDAGDAGGLSLTKEATIALPGIPQAAAFDSVNGRLYVATQTFNASNVVTACGLSIVDGATDVVLASAALSVSSRPTGVAVSPSSHHVYLATSDGVLVFDESTNARTATAPIKSATVGVTPGGVVADGTNVYVLETASGKSAELLVIDATTDTLTKSVTITDGNYFSPDFGGVAVDGSTHYVYILTQSIATSSDALLTVLDGTSQAVIGTPTHYTGEFPGTIVGDAANVYFTTSTSAGGVVGGRVRAVDPVDITLPDGYKPSGVFPGTPPFLTILVSEPCGENGENYFSYNGVSVTGPFAVPSVNDPAGQFYLSLNAFTLLNNSPSVDNTGSVWISYKLRADCTGSTLAPSEVQHFTY